MRGAVVAVMLLGVPAVVPLRAADPPRTGIDGEQKKPYQVRVAVKFSDHPALTSSFRESLMRELLNGLRTALGNGGDATVVDLTAMPASDRDGLMRIVMDRGLEGLDGPCPVDGRKTHFLAIDFVEGRYVVDSRQCDGTAGLVTPVIRQTVTADRGFVGRLTIAAIARDFGVVGTFDPAGGKQVGVTLKASGLMSMTGWVGVGEVFAVVQMREVRRIPKVGPKEKRPQPIIEQTGTRIDGALLQVIEAPTAVGTCVCRVHYRYSGPLPRDAATIGYRAVKLGTAEAPLQLRLTDSAGKSLGSESVRVRAGADDYPEAGRDRDELPHRDSIFISRGPMRHVAFVVVASSGRTIARIPVEVYGDRVTLRKVNLDPTADQRAYWQGIVGDMLDRIVSARVRQARVFDEVGRLQQAEKQPALDYGEKALKQLDAESFELRDDLGRLRERIGKDAPAGSLDSCDAEIKSLANKSDELRRHLDRLREVIKVENDPAQVAKRKAVEGLLLEAKFLVERDDIDGALAKYDEAINASDPASPAVAEIRKTAAKLRADWEPKDDAHRQARKFIYESWPKLERPPEVRDQLGAARKAMDQCRTVGDRVSLRKMYGSAPNVLEKYAELLKKMIDEAVEDEDKKALEGYSKVTDDLQALVNDLAKAVGAGVAPPPAKKP